jgi:hypothetical protein
MTDAVSGSAQALMRNRTGTRTIVSAYERTRPAYFPAISSA